jgi:hypothetical protein
MDGSVANVECFIQRKVLQMARLPLHTPAISATEVCPGDGIANVWPSPSDSAYISPKNRLLTLRRYNRRI